MTELQNTLDESTLPRDFQRGLKAVRETVDEREPPLDSHVQPIDKNGTNVVVRFGIWPTDRYPTINYDDLKYVVFGQIPERFPTGEGKGFATIPPLSRSDQALVNNDEWSDKLDSIVEQHTKSDANAECYSHNWKHTNMSQPEDMSKFLNVVDEFLSRG